MDNLIKIIDKNIIIDVIETWPNELINIIESNKEKCLKFLNFEKEIDEKAEIDFFMINNEIPNPHQEFWKKVKKLIRIELEKNKFIGFHCTRLIDFEILDILKNGLQPLSENITIERLKYLSENNYIEKDIEKFLVYNNLSKDKNRKNMIWFFCGKNTSKNKIGLFRLFRAWGGEAVYWKNETISQISNKLFNIGEPCIVLSQLEYIDLNKYNNLEEKFINIYLNKNNLNRISYDFDCNINYRPKTIYIIKKSNNLFEKLTKFSTW